MFVETEEDSESWELHEEVGVSDGENVDHSQREDQAKEDAVEELKFPTLVQNTEHQNIQGNGKKYGYVRCDTVNVWVAGEKLDKVSVEAHRSAQTLKIQW